MAYSIGSLVGALIAIYLVSRLLLWLLKRLGDSEGRILLAHGITFVVAVIAGGFGFAGDGPPDFIGAAQKYILATVVWLVVDLFALRGRRARSGGS